MSSLLARFRRRREDRYDLYMQREREKLDALAASPSWTCSRCGLTQTDEGRYVAKYWGGSNYSDVWHRADFVAMSCWNCGAPIIKTVTR